MTALEQASSIGYKGYPAAMQHRTAFCSVECYQLQYWRYTLMPLNSN